LEFAAAAITAARSSGGLVDPTLVGAIERCGYRHSRVNLAPASLAEALAWAPSRRPARPGAGLWRAITVDRDGATIARPPGLRLDSGGVGKGLAADLMAQRLDRFPSYVIDCGGDMRVGGRLGLPRPIEVTDPFGPGVAARLELAHGAVATSGL